MKNVLVIQGIDKSDNERTVIGVADGIENALLLIDKYYGNGQYKQVAFDRVRESNIEFEMTIECKSLDETPYACFIWGEWFIGNEV